MVIWIIFIVVRLVFYVLVLQTMKPNIENEKKKISYLREIVYRFI